MAVAIGGVALGEVPQAGIEQIPNAEFGIRTPTRHGQDASYINWDPDDYPHWGCHQNEEKATLF